MTSRPPISDENYRTGIPIRWATSPVNIIKIQRPMCIRVIPHSLPTPVGYPCHMKYKNLLYVVGKAGFGLNGLLLLTLTGCVARVDGPSAGIYVSPPVVEVAAPAEYVYYPGYNVYFNSDRHEFAYMDGGVWVSRPSFPGVSINVLLASPSVRMDFHDSPANHHAEISRRYPRNWAPPGGHPVSRAETEKAQAKRAPARKPSEPKPSQKPQKPEKREDHDSKDHDSK